MGEARGHGRGHRVGIQGTPAIFLFSFYLTDFDSTPSNSHMSNPARARQAQSPSTFGSTPSLPAHPSTLSSPFTTPSTLYHPDAKNMTPGSHSSCLEYSPTSPHFFFNPDTKMRPLGCVFVSGLQISSVLLDISFLVNCHISIVSFFVFFVLYKIEIKISLSFLLVLSSSDQNLTGSVQNLLRTTQILVRSDQILWETVKYCTSEAIWIGCWSGLNMNILSADYIYCTGILQLSTLRWCDFLFPFFGATAEIVDENWM